MTPTKEILSISDLCLGFSDGKGKINRVLEDVNFCLHRGETLGIVGESGSGKSITSLAVMGLLPKTARVTKGKIVLSVNHETIEPLTASEEQLRRFRGKSVSMIFQEPMTSLNPVQKCGRQVAEILLEHGLCKKAKSRERVVELFRKVDLPRPESIYESYPHQISGGQKQRVMIAMAVACQPELIIADEPTTALDVTVQKRILGLLKSLCAESNTGLIFITHDLGVVNEIADRIVVMFRGKIVEEGKTNQILRKPEQPYTKALIECRPKLENNPARLPVVDDFMKGNPDLRPANAKPKNVDEVILSVDDTSVHFPIKQQGRGAAAYFKALDGVNFKVFKNETLGLVGESGCGKSTLGRAIVGLQRVHFGEIRYKDEVIASPKVTFPKSHRRRIQIIFQDPYSSLNPGMTVEEILTEPLVIHRLAKTSAERSKKVAEMLDKVGLPEESRQKYPHQFSGGQRQRICIARTLMVKPDFIVCDESVSALDVSVQAMILNLLNDLKEEFGLTYIFISHDLSVVKYISDRIMVMRKGKIEEIGSAEEIYKKPASDYTKELIDSIPRV